MITSAIGDQCQLVGDDLFVTSDKRLQIGVNKKAEIQYLLN